MKFMIDYYAKLTQKQREGKLWFRAFLQYVEQLIANNFDSDYPEYVKNSSPKLLIQ